jgi:hypothetical protein
VNWKTAAQDHITEAPNLEVRDLSTGDPFAVALQQETLTHRWLYNPRGRDNGSNSKSEPGFVTYVTFFGHFGCP